MLVLTRKRDESIVIGDDIKIRVVKMNGNAVRLGIEDPQAVRILRGELRDEKMTEAQAA
jgi:carbon storage regulator CsrA